MDKKPKKPVRKATAQEKRYGKAAIRDIKGKKLNESQRTVLGSDPTTTSGMHGNINQVPKSQREAAQRRFDRETATLKETKIGQRVQKVQAKKGTERTESRYNVQKREAQREASNSAFKDSAYKKIKGMYRG